MTIGNWKYYYDLGKEIYRLDHKDIKKSVNLYDITIEEHNQTDPVIDRQVGDYHSSVGILAKKVNSLFADDKNYTKRARCYALDNIWSCKEEIQSLAKVLVPQVEEKVFQSYVHVDNIKIYRSPVSSESDTSSWLWHFDNNPREQIKILIYLTDVGEGDGEFTYVCGKDGKGTRVATSRVSYPDNWRNPWDNPPPLYRLEKYHKSWVGSDRVPHDIIKYLCDNGNHIRKSTGPSGTLFLFDNNIIHKATVPKNNYRDVIVFQLKPSIEKITPYINERNTGNGWEHTTFNKDPAILDAIKA